MLPQHAQVHSNYAVGLRQAGELAGADVQFNRAIAIDPNHAETRFNYGNLLIELRRFDVVIEAALQFLVITEGFEPGRWRVWVSLGHGVR